MMSNGCVYVGPCLDVCRRERESLLFEKKKIKKTEIRDRVNKTWVYACGGQVSPPKFKNLGHPKPKNVSRNVPVSVQTRVKSSIHNERKIIRDGMSQPTLLNKNIVLEIYITQANTKNRRINADT